MHKLKSVALLWWAAWISSHSELWSPSGSILILQSLSSSPLNQKLKCWQLPTNFCADVRRHFFFLADNQQILDEDWKIQKFDVLLGVWGGDCDPLWLVICSAVFSGWDSPGFSIWTTQLCSWPLVPEPCTRDLRQDSQFMWMLVCG